MNKSLTSLLLTLSCLASLPGCAPLLAARDADVEVPAHFARASTETRTAAEMAWKRFFDDPQLVTLIDTALSRNQEVKMAMQDIYMANNEITARAGEYMPSIRLQGETELGKVAQSYLRTRSEEDLEADAEERPQPLPTFKVGAFLSWELDAWRRLRNAKDAAVYEYMASVEGRKFLITQLVAEIANSYYELMALDNKLANMEESVRIQRNVLEIIRQLKASARSNELAVKRFEAEVQKNQSLIYAIRQDIVETENKLNFLVGRPPQKVLRNSSLFSELQVKAVASGLPSDLLRNRPDIKKAEHELAATRLDVEVAQKLFQFARADYMEVLLTQREAIEARNELIETRQAQMGAMVNLYQALGGGWQDEAEVPKPAC